MQNFTNKQGMSMKSEKLILIATIIFITSTTSAYSALISGPSQILFSSQVGVESIGAGSFDQTVDGILDVAGQSSINNGISINSLPASITYNFDQAYNLESFFLLGEVGSNSLNAVKNFRLSFFSELNGTGTNIGNDFEAVHTTPSSLQEFQFSSGAYTSVRSFTFTPLTIQNPNLPQITPPDTVEFSEIQFDGTPLQIAIVSEPRMLSLIIIGIIVFLAVHFSHNVKRKLWII